MMRVDQDRNGGNDEKYLNLGYLECGAHKIS